MKNMKRIIVGVFLTFCITILAFAKGDMPVGISVYNDTICLYDANTLDTVYIVKPISIYAFTGNENNLVYSGVEVGPNEHQVVPLGTTVFTNPPQAALFLGTIPNDYRGHIPSYIPASNLQERTIVQAFNAGSFCSRENPCAWVARGNVVKKCISLMQKHSQ
jgi:hypothetical protein